ncbi:hypothetical protein [Flavobacterium aquatile]|uniref:Lipoprotein n=1 Tax=Flavobacterium aquatile LMG 4008 = ATCC 11947 TaxID=1453498 RepID=A0A095SSA7_9FLAO|nr:hypothetical protein [Flavobacterium aquatile]KGD67239.1 hypothetical protein LG45_13520 [Flavobacterium aquatile LMG 4008 = ATCC 11947]OXA66610.1 hypothetical protein B0A61_10385 [Flavobacterium aquatile LMG 4008 = ATCC 11947]GEC78590.1 hypothetical protein FAQ01_14600 [Flavobacterium aquatile]
MKTLIFSIFIFSIISCSKNENPTPPFFANATVVNQGVDCGNAYLIKFNNGVANVPANSTNNVFYEINLPNQYKVNNLPVYVTFRLPTDSEIMNCTSLDIAYPQIYIETATAQ